MISTYIQDRDAIAKTQLELISGMQLVKCQQCGCMRGALDAFTQWLQGVAGEEVAGLSEKVTSWKAQMKPIRYACLGCEHCYPSVAENFFAEAFPEAELTPALTCGYQVVEGEWPAVLGEYFTLNKTAPVVVATLASVSLAQKLADLKPAGLALVGKLETENIGIDKVVKNVVSNPAIRFVIVAGVEPNGHHSGSALLALSQNGVDENKRVIGSTARRPVLRNVTLAEIDGFRKQVQVVDLRDCEDPAEIAARVKKLASHESTACACGDICTDEHGSPGSGVQPVWLASPLPSVSNADDKCSDPDCSCHSGSPVSPEIVAAVDAGQPIPLDKAGYFVILPVAERGVINVEHYGYDNTLLHAIEGTNARALYLIIVDRGWVSELSHAAYLGKELAKAELSLSYGFKYIQDGS
jgi:tetrahydromethanopterin S-methyltransferase subunit A